MIKVYNHNRTYRLDALDGSFMIVRANSFSEIEDKFTGCSTYKMAIEAGEFEPFTTTKEGDKLEEKAHNRKKAATAE